MRDSPMIPFPGRDFDATNPAHVRQWLKVLGELPAPRPEKRSDQDGRR